MYDYTIQVLCRNYKSVNPPFRIIQLKPKVHMIPTLLSLSAPMVVKTTTPGATSYEQVGIMTTIGLKYV